MTINQFDLSITSAVQSWPAWLHPVMAAATFVGLPSVIIGLGLVGAAAAYHDHQPRAAWAQLASLAALGGNGILKHFLHRTRPDTLYVTTMKFKSSSFPSGHAFGSAVFYGLLAYLAYRNLPAPWNLIVAALLTILIILIGLSRVYLGAHYPTDVLAGWALGFLSLILIISLLRP